ncbi:MAG: EamA family transporter RarD, partial [Acidobacteriota bacterium]
PDRAHERAGLVYGTAGFLFWGLSPIFWKLIDHVPAMQLLAHRVIWCGLLMAGILVLRQDRELFRALRRRKTFLMLVFSTVLIGTNWYAYIYAVVSGQILQASLGYFINPLVSVLFGVVFLREELRPQQKLAVTIAGIGVAILTWHLGELPWISLFLAFSFAVYGLVRKTVDATPEQGLALETWLLTPLALIYLLTQHQGGAGALGAHGLSSDLLLLLTGAVTATPLLLFTHGTRRLPLSTIGILQYIAPTCQFLLAVLVYREDFEVPQFVAFLFIWTALGIFTADLRQAAKRQAAARGAAA